MSRVPLPVIALTPGEPAGIGPDITIRLLQGFGGRDFRLVIIADPTLLEQRAQQLGIPLNLPLWQRDGNSKVSLLPIALGVPAIPGRLDPANGAYVIATLDAAVTGCQRGEFAALVTGPVHKGVINEAGIPFTGHTEFLAQKAQVSQVVMMLVSGTLRVALATTHLPLAQVSAHITQPNLLATLRILQQELRVKFGLKNPNILVCGLNPHAGEAGHLGREEIEIITPVIKQLKAEGLNLHGPVPADTAFTPERLKNVDVVLAMYHDQGLPVLKFQGFGRAVNISLGLPFVRTSVDHGTALELAGTAKADLGSLQAALETALTMVHARHLDS